MRKHISLIILLSSVLAACGSDNNKKSSSSASFSSINSSSLSAKSESSIFESTSTSTSSSSIASDTDFLQSEDAYLGETPPGDVPVIFAPSVISQAGMNVATLTFSPDGRQCIFFIETGSINNYAMFTEFRDGEWTLPVKAWFSETRTVTEPMFSPDGTRIYFSSNEPTNTYGADLWYIERKGTSWSEPVHMGTPVNSSGYEFHPSPVADGSIYFTNNNGAIVRSQYSNGKYLEPVVLPETINLQANPPAITWGDPYVSPDESYMIFKSNRSGGSGGYDNYISYRNADDGSWSVPNNLGATINSAANEIAGDISPDGKYLFFGRGGNIYWVRADFINKLH
jgi:Tol biopolymer transport system component